MLIRTNIYNRNYYPIKIYNLTETILDSDKSTISPDQYINDTTFNNHNGALIKPFQSTEWVSSVSLNDFNKDFIGHIYLDSTINTDSIDYGSFGVLTGQDVNIKHHYVTLKTSPTVSSYGLITKDIADQFTESSLISIKFSMKDIEDWGDILSHLKSSGFSEYDIEDFSFFGEGIYGINLVDNPPARCNGEIMVRSGVKVTNDTIYSLTSINTGNKFKVYKDGDNVQFELLLIGTSMKTLFDTIQSNYDEYIDALSSGGEIGSGGLSLPIYQQPLGMSVILQMRTLNGSTPYKLNLKILTPIMFMVDIAADETTVTETSEIKPILNFIKSPASENYNNLLCIPTQTTLRTNQTSPFTAHIQLIPFSINSLFPNPIISDESFYTINDVHWKISDSNISTNKLTFITDTYPVKKIIPTELLSNIDNSFDIYVDATGISSDYTNTLVINYSYDSTNLSIETDVIIKPNLPVGVPEINPVNNSLFFENAYQFSALEPTFGSLTQPYDTYNFATLGDDVLHLKLENSGEVDATIVDVKLENPYVSLEQLNSLVTKSDEDLNNIAILTKFIEYHKYSTGKTNSIYNNSKEAVIDNILETSSIDNFLSYNIINIDNKVSNLLNIATIDIKLNVSIFKKCKNYMSGLPIILKVIYTGAGSSTKYTKYIYEDQLFTLNLVIGEVALQYDKSIEAVKYIRPNAPQTMFVNVYRKFMFDSMWSSLNSTHKQGVTVTSAALVTYDNDANPMTLDEISLNSSQFPMSVPSLSTSGFFGFSYDLNLTREALYKYKIRLYTSYKYVPYIDIPFSTVATSVDIEDVIKFDSDNFYVRNNKYFLSLIKLQTKYRKISIVNTSNMNVDILGIETYTLQDKFGVANIDLSITNKITFPFTLTQLNSLILDISVIGKDFGHYNSFIILKTDRGDVYLSISSYVNTKYKDVLVMMENVKGTSFISSLNGSDVDYIKLTNFGDDESLLEITKLGYDQNEFLISNIDRLSPNTINYIENIFVPTSTGKKIGYLDFKIRDMLETYRLLDTDDEYVFKIQNSHILAEMVGIALTEHAMPHFSKGVVDFGYVSVTNTAGSNRVDTFTIKNYGLTPFIITNITKSDISSPFEIPLIGQQLPIKVDKEITLPISVITNKLVSNKSVYVDIFKFEIQDLKTKRIFNHEIIVKIELTAENREYMSFNSNFIEFGYCEINNFKTEDIIIKNFSTDKVDVTIAYEGDVELQTLENFNFNLQPNQQFTVPIYFYPHGIDNFTGKLILNFNNGNYIKNIDLFGYGVDFKSPLVSVDNKMAEYYSTLKTYLNKSKYV